MGELTDKDRLEMIEIRLIELIEGTIHHSALDNLTRALAEVRKTVGYLDGDKIYVSI